MAPAAAGALALKDKTVTKLFCCDYLDSLVVLYHQQILVTTDNILGLSINSTGYKFVIIRITTDA